MSETIPESAFAWPATATPGTKCGPECRGRAN